MTRVGIPGTCPIFKKNVLIDNSVSYKETSTKQIAPLAFSNFVVPNCPQIHIGCPAKLQIAPVVQILDIYVH